MDRICFQHPLVKYRDDFTGNGSTNEKIYIFFPLTIVPGSYSEIHSGGGGGDEVV